MVDAWELRRFVAWVALVPGIGPFYMDYKYGSDDPDLPALPKCLMPKSRNDGILAAALFMLKPLVAWFIFACYVPLIWGAKKAVGMWISLVVCIALVVSVCLVIANMCAPDKVAEMKTNSFIDTFTACVDMKCRDAHEKKKEGLVKWLWNKGIKYIKGTFNAICCCGMCKPSQIYIFSKIMATLLITEVLMALSTWVYITIRFIIGTFTWTMFSFEGWLRELLTCNSIKNRIMFMAYPALWEKSAGKEANPLPPIQALNVAAPACCLTTCGCFQIVCPALGCKMPECPNGCCGTCCGACCGGCFDCNLVCDFTCTMCTLGLDVFDGFVALILVVGKASMYTDRMISRLLAGDMPDAPRAAWGGENSAPPPPQNEPSPAPPAGTDSPPASAPEPQSMGGGERLQ